MEDVSVIKKAAEMNAEHLLAHFDRIADTPDAIPRLRRFILDLAVRGKLVPQDPNDEPASELLKRIAVEKARLVREKKISKQIPFLPFDLSEVPFDLPDSWAWCPSTYPSYIVSDKGKKVQTKDVFETGEFPVVDQGKVLIRGYHNDANKVICIKAPLVLFGDHTREMKLIDFDFVVGADGVKLLQPVSLHTPYYFVALQWLPLESRGYGRHFKLLKASFIPLPPLAEQHRIVAKVDELMTLCDRLEAARMEREATRNRMATANLARLNAPDPDPATFQNHAAFALNNLTPLTTRPDQIKALRQTILNLAVRGNLVPQDPNDEPASELLKRIAADRGRLEKNRTIKESKPLPPVDAVDAPLDLPVGWAWARFPEVGLFGRGKSKHRPRNDPILYTDGEYPFIQTGDVARSGGSIETYSNFYNDVGLAQSAMWPAGTLCITIAANIADSGILSFDACFPDSIVGLIVHESFEDARFFEYFIRTAKADLHEFAPSTAQKNINLGILTEVLIPLPPLAEQHRIVAKVDDLMDLCDRLEANLSVVDDSRGQLIDAVLTRVMNFSNGLR